MLEILFLVALQIRAQSSRLLARMKASGCVQPQKPFSRSAYCCKRNDLDPIQLKVMSPLLRAWIEQGHQLTREWIER